MAVYTKLNQKKIEEILSNYNLGKLDSFKAVSYTHLTLPTIVGV